MAWGFRKFTRTVLNGFCSSYTVDKINDLKESTEDWDRVDYDAYQHVTKTGEFKLEYRPKKKEDSKNQDEW